MRGAAPRRFVGGPGKARVTFCVDRFHGRSMPLGWTFGAHSLFGRR